MSEITEGSVGGKESILAFCDDTETYNAVSHVFSDLILNKTSIKKGGIKDAVKYLSNNSSPDLLLVDLNKSELPISDIDQLANVCDPGVKVIAIGELNDCGLFRDLLNHGVTEYLVKPISSSLLHRAINKIETNSHDNKNHNKLGKLIPVIGTRGGVGATTIATSIAWLIASERKRQAALIDLDIQFGNAALSLDIEPSRGFKDALENPENVDNLLLDRALVNHSERYSILSAEENIGEQTNIDKQSVELIIDELRKKFHYVIVDLPRLNSMIFNQVLTNSTDAMIVTDLSLAAMRDTIRIIKYVPFINASCKISVILNKSDIHKNGGLSKSDYERGIGRKVDVTIPFESKSVGLSINSGRPAASGRGAVPNGLREISDILCGPTAGILSNRKKGLKTLYFGKDNL